MSNKIYKFLELLNIYDHWAITDLCTDSLDMYYNGEDDYFMFVVKDKVSSHAFSRLEVMAEIFGMIVIAFPSHIMDKYNNVQPVFNLKIR